MLAHVPEGSVCRVRKRPWLYFAGGVDTGLLLVGLRAAEPLFLVSRSAADQLLDRGQYIRAVLGGSP